jgi:CD109 antigen
MAAYVAAALADYGAEAVGPALLKAAGYLEAQRSTVDSDPYSLAIACLALTKTPGFEGTAAQIADRLVELAKLDGAGLHWEPYPIETTGYAALSLLSLERPQAASAIEWLSTQRNSLGGYGQSTQDTVVAIRALIAAAMKVRSSLDLTLTVLDGETSLTTLRVNDSNYDLLQSFELPAGRGSGLALRAQGSGSAGYQVVRKYHVPGERLPPPRDMSIDVIYDAQGIEVDQVVDVKVRVAYTGPKAETGMTIVDVSVPTGFEAVRTSLDALLASKTVSRADVAGRKVIFYVDGLKTGSPMEFTFQVKALYPVRSEPPISKAYEYYDPAVQATTRGAGLVVNGAGPRAFVRGDVNSDGKIDLTDVVAALGFLFQGHPASIECPRSADIDDSGRLDVSDPIYLLKYEFMGGAAPAQPFPACGPDARGPGGLSCEAFDGCR